MQKKEQTANINDKAHNNNHSQRGHVSTVRVIVHNNPRLIID